MNPPAALLGSMSRERKPFTYTPGGLDLSEIKSEKMAKRLMRNAMNQGVPEVQPHSVQSPTTPSTSITIPNFNCLPVQVFPSFSLPANPKSLLRTRSYPDEPKVPPPFQCTPLPSQYQTKYDNIELSDDITSRSMDPQQPSTNHDSSGVKDVLLPEMCYDAEYLRVVPRLIEDVNKGLSMPITIITENEKVDNSALNLKEIQRPQSKDQIETSTKKENLVPIEELTDAEYDQRGVRLVKKVKKEKKVEEKETKIDSKQNGDSNVETDLTVKIPQKKLGAKVETQVDVKRKILANGKVEETKTTTTKTTINGETEVSSKTDTRILSEEEAEAVKKTAKEQEIKTKSDEKSVTNGSTDTEIVLKIPTKKTGAKTETKVAIENKILSDGTVEETKTTTTTTTIDGKTEVKTKVDKRILSKEEADAIIEVEEEEVEEEETEELQQNEKVNGEKHDNKSKITIIKNEEESETKSKKDIVTQDEKEQESEEEIEEEKEELRSELENLPNQKTIDTEQEKEQVIKEKISKQSDSEEENGEDIEENNEKEEYEIENITARQIKVEEEEIHAQNENEVSEGEEEEEEDISEQEVVEELEKDNKKITVEENVEEEEEYEEAEEKPEKTDVVKEKTVEESECSEEEYESENEQIPTDSLDKKIEIKVEKDDCEDKETNIKSKEIESKNTEQPNNEIPLPLKEPVVPLEKVEELEIKPIGSGTVTKTHTEKTEIVVSSDTPLKPLSTQTEFNRYENIVTVNRTTKTLDKSYEQLTQQGVPTVKTYFAPTRDKVSPTPQPARPYQPVYASEPQPERRHSLLLERLSVERQPPTNDIYQNYHNLPQDEQRQWSQEPQSEILTTSNVKPSKISNQQWYQQTKTENVMYNNVTPTTPKPAPVWTKPQTPQTQPKPQPQFQTQPQHQQQPQYQQQPQFQQLPQFQQQPHFQQQPIYPQQSQYQSQPQTQLQSEVQPQYQYQPSYTENKIQDYSKSTTTFYQESYPSYQSTAAAPAVPSKQYSFVNKDPIDSYQPNTQQYSSNYVPPPWEQDTTYATNNAKQNYCQPPQTPASTFTPTQSWKPPHPSNKFSKLSTTSYTPPAPNQSFVKSAPNVEPPKLPGRKTYYSEYERRYITVPESNYVPGETKLQPQPDPSPKYYYDNNETTEPVEHKWRKELREFTEKTSQTQYQTEETIARPPWEENSKHTNIPASQFSQTPTWSQTLRPRSWRERSFEAEYTGTQDYSKPQTQTNTLGRSRPVSSYTHNDSKAQFTERVRGVSVDRYNPNNYQSPLPAEHPPVQSHTLTPSNAPPPKGYHNPNVPAYHTRASVETREQPVTYRQPRSWGESRASPIQSRSFKYLQWITGTDE